MLGEQRRFPSFPSSQGRRCLRLRGIPRWPCDLGGSRERGGADSLASRGTAFQSVLRCTREYLGETLTLGRLLNISLAGRPDAATKDILPEDIGLDAAGNGDRWSIGRFKENGITAAKAAGISKPTADDIAWFGLYEAAKRNPLPTTDAEAEDFLRLAFYTLGPEVAKSDPAAVDYVAEQVSAFLKDHINDSTEEFDQWIQDRKSNLIGRIAKRKDCQWTREEVRQAMLELGWRSFKLLAKSIDACAGIRCCLAEAVDERGKEALCPDLLGSSGPWKNSVGIAARSV